MRIVNQYTFKKKSKRPLIVALGICLVTSYLAIGTNSKAESSKDISREEKAVYKPKNDVKEDYNPRREIIKKSNIYGINPRLAVAISRLETGNWTSKGYTLQNNFGGMQVDGRTLCFETKTEGLATFIENLKYGYIDRGLTSPKEIAKVYCPDNAEHWAREVEKIMEEE